MAKAMSSSSKMVYLGRNPYDQLVPDSFSTPASKLEHRIQKLQAEFLAVIAELKLQCQEDFRLLVSDEDLQSGMRTLNNEMAEINLKVIEGSIKHLREAKEEIKARNEQIVQFMNNEDASNLQKQESPIIDEAMKPPKPDGPKASQKYEDLKQQLLIEKELREKLKDDLEKEKRTTQKMMAQDFRTLRTLRIAVQNSVAETKQLKETLKKERGRIQYKIQRDLIEFPRTHHLPLAFETETVKDLQKQVKNLTFQKQYETDRAQRILNELEEKSNEFDVKEQKLADFIVQLNGTVTAKQKEIEGLQAELLAAKDEHFDFDCEMDYFELCLKNLLAAEKCNEDVDVWIERLRNGSSFDRMKNTAKLFMHFKQYHDMKVYKAVVVGNKFHNKLIRCESQRQALVNQKQYLMSREDEKRHVKKPIEPIRKFKSAVLMIVAVIRMRNIAIKWQNRRHKMMWPTNGSCQASTQVKEPLTTEPAAAVEPKLNPDTQPKRSLHCFD